MQMTNTYLAVGLLCLAPLSATAQEAACATQLDIDMPAACHQIDLSHPVGALSNFRELVTPDQGIKPGVLFRSDQLDALTPADQSYLEAKGIETIIDLRAPDELATHPNKPLQGVDFNVSLPIGSDPADIAKIMPVEVAERIRPLWFEGKFHEIDQLLSDHDVDLAAIRIDRYRDFGTDFSTQVSRFLHILADDSSYPVLFHCAGGKDRTGYLAAVTLLVLGYSEEDALRDYLTTNLFTFGELEKLVGHGPKSLRPAFGAHPEQMKAALQAVKDQYGSFEAYRRDVLKISDAEVAAIRSNLLR